jgi:hypothetical protein
LPRNSLFKEAPFVAIRIQARTGGSRQGTVHQVCLEILWESTGFPQRFAWLFGHTENGIVDRRIDVDGYNANLHRIPAVHPLTHVEGHHHPVDGLQ